MFPQFVTCCFVRKGLEAELQAAQKESDCARQRLRNLENDLTQYKQRNQELEEQLGQKTGEC